VLDFITRRGVSDKNLDIVKSILSEVDLQSIIYNKEAMTTLLTKLGLRANEELMAELQRVLGEVKDKGMETVIEIIDFLNLSDLVDVA